MPSKYQEILTTIIDQIENGKLHKGERIPSIRRLSQKFHCSKDTVQRALLELKFKNYIYAVEKSGYYVLEGKSQKETPLNLSLSDYNNMAYEDFTTCLTETLVNRENYLFNYYYHQEGLQELIDSLQEYLEKSAIYAKKEDILVTSGTQQALYILSQLPFPNHKKTILLEQPTYHRMNDLVTSLKLPYQTIERDFEGIDLARLEELFKTGDIKFFYTISRFSNPLGLSYLTSEKQRIVELAERYDVYIIEDDYMGDFAKSTDLPLHYYDTSGHVIYLKSFSMTIFPALRLGTIILPPALTKPFLDHKKMIDYDTNLIMQKALSLYLDSGLFEKNLNYLKQVFQKQRQKIDIVLADFPRIQHFSSSLQGLVLELPKDQHLGDLKFTDKINYLEDNYLSLTEKRFIKLSNNQDIFSILRMISER
ncbi:PLP-dependent aminotransferase family protein [Streptococcus infantarius]|uniref:aminotransferase-like domain-containing protein n=1 Tax=Streptococcus infantarius TaxID=102684 RepID=UPI00208F7849|nr:PLP-dependent aminotransferase family protein [Streptococcus infantarius]MCO4486924.1 transcriptional regulator, GntR family [Streptococcus infantarius subsp. infantarius]MCO4493833.1 transcriptional regulator, GntR family [Streptococcus infantarius subsp. infantarius]MCO4500078.1 transcriptional regulator, GntR family [Streptococcus infantarius subsp. infantarius]MCO4502038.1 transcriptional regulator, GntR family [Streptococcus infantarius subsp. infantarius]MCO4504502.1 transcriptional r